jgi:hypothetical protein
MRPDQIKAALAQCVRDLEEGMRAKPGSQLTSVVFAKAAIDFLNAQEANSPIGFLESDLEHRWTMDYTAPDAPTLHLNGSDGEVLAKGYREAVEKVHEALEALRATVPHGRDYYVKAGDGIGKALLMHQRRVHALECMLHELKGLYFAVRQQQEERKRKD